MVSLALGADEVIEKPKIGESIVNKDLAHVILPLNRPNGIKQW